MLSDMLSVTKNEFHHMHIMKPAAGEKIFICGSNLKKSGVRILKNDYGIYILITEGEEGKNFGFRDYVI